MCEYTEITITLPDGYEAYGRYWQAPESKGAVLYHHGIQSHCGWYEGSARRLQQAGYCVLQVDRRGCGRNSEQRGHADSADQLISDAICGRDELLKRSGHQNYHVVGVSWGGRLAVASYVKEPKGVASISLVTPGLFPLVGVSREMMSEIGQAMLYEPLRYFEIPLGDPERFTSDPKWLEFIRTDELTLREATAGFYLASRRLDKIIAKLATQNPIPIQLLLAGDEQIIDNDKTKQFISDLHWPYTPLIMYDGLRHSLEVEGDAERFYRDVIGFFDSAS